MFQIVKVGVALELPGSCLGAASNGMKVAFPNALLTLQFERRFGVPDHKIWRLFIRYSRFQVVM